ncbi:MAG: CorA family divalent cation transporter [Synergistaceae bacterium]
MYFNIEKTLIKTETPKPPYVFVLTYGEFSEADSLPCGFDKLHVARPEALRFCKVETHQEKFYASFTIPKRRNGAKKISFSCCISGEAILFIDDSGYVSGVLEEITNTTVWKQPSVGRFLFSFLEAVIQSDLELLESIEDSLLKMESSVLENKFDGFHRRMMPTRKAILSSAHYYSQMADMVNEFVEDENDIFSGQEEKLFKIFCDRAIRLRGETQMLREYAGQISEIYQAQIDIYQNKVMKILTVVTTIFLPLSLLAGWYGMNFKYMPELAWPYSYPLLAAASAAIVVLSLYILKKRNFW